MASKLTRDAFKRVTDSLLLTKEPVHVAVAVSGGRDSMALAHLLKHTLSGKTLALTVDHGLRSDSTKEATFVRDAMNRLGLDHAILDCSWPSGQPRFGCQQQRAREQRYDLLGRESARRQIKYLFVGHHMNDQLETLMYRISRASGIDGLACMKATSPLIGHSGILLVRPLLSFSRTSIIEYCLESGIQWIDDPSNVDSNYRRVAIRRVLNEFPRAEQLHSLVNVFSQAQKTLSTKVALAFDDAVAVNSSYGFATVNISKLAALEKPVRIRLLSQTIQRVSVSPYAPPLASLINVDFTKGTSIAGCLLSPKNNNLLIARQARSNSPQLIRLDSQMGNVKWDRRFVISWKNQITSDHQFYVRHMRKSDLAVCSRGIKRIPHLCRQGLPVICDVMTDAVVSMPHAGYKDPGWKRIHWTASCTVGA